MTVQQIQYVAYTACSLTLVVVAGFCLHRASVIHGHTQRLKLIWCAVAFMAFAALAFWGGTRCHSGEALATSACLATYWSAILLAIGGSRDPDAE